ncbi:hypothetical protein [Methylomagnum sp.]
MTRILGALSLTLIAGSASAGGRYANPPVNLLEVQAACTKGLEAAQKSDTAAALEQAKIGRKLALASYKEISTMPMEIGSSTMKKAIPLLEAGNVAESVAEFEHCKAKMDEEFAYYKKEGKF